MTTRRLRVPGEVKNYHWANKFLEAAIRAMRRIHLDEVAASSGSPGPKNPSKPELLNIGRGIELTDERQVCQAIYNEFRLSNLGTGYWVNADQMADVASGQRFYDIAIEHPYTASRELVDFCIWRNVLSRSGAFRKFDNTETFVEAKRATRWSPLQASEPVFTRSGSQILDVRRDVSKLLVEMKKRTPEQGKLTCHVLVWGTSEDKYPSPADFFSKLAHKQVEIYRTGWAPLATEERSTAGSEWNSNPPNIARWLWATLAEVHPESAWWLNERNA